MPLSLCATTVAWSDTHAYTDGRSPRRGVCVTDSSAREGIGMVGVQIKSGDTDWNTRGEGEFLACTDVEEYDSMGSEVD